MKKMLLLITTTIFVSDIFSQSVSPYVISPIGSFYTNSIGSLSWTLGETVIATLNNNNNILTQGFQQSSYKINAVNENKNKTKLSIYPNPSSGIVNINYLNKSHYKLDAVIYNIEGIKLFEKQINNTDNIIDLSCFESSIFLLKIFDTKGKIINTYKIQKIN